MVQQQNEHLNESGFGEWCHPDRPDHPPDAVKDVLVLSFMSELSIAFMLWMLYVRHSSSHCDEMDDNQKYLQSDYINLIHTQHILHSAVHSDTHNTKASVLVLTKHFTQL